MTDVQQVAEAARHAATKPQVAPADVDDLARRRRFTIDAAYAYARRRAQDPAWNAAANLLELVIVRRARRPAGGVRAWQRIEVVVAVVVVLMIAWTFLLVVFTGRPSGFGLFWVVFLGLHIWQARNQPELELERVDAAGAGHVPRATREVLRSSSELVQVDTAESSVSRLRRVAGDHPDDEVMRALAAVALARAQRAVAGLPVRHRRRRLQLLDAARRAQLQAVPPSLLRD